MPIEGAAFGSRDKILSRENRKRLFIGPYLQNVCHRQSFLHFAVYFGFSPARIFFAVKKNRIIVTATDVKSAIGSAR